MEIVTKERAKYKHFGERERYKLEILFEQGTKVSKIGKLLKKNRSTIYREIKRGSLQLQNSDLSETKRYRADVGQRISEERGSQRERSLKIGKDKELEKHILERMKKKKYSPDAVIGEIRRKGLRFEGMICTKTLYNYIEKGIFSEISNKDLWEKRKRKTGKYKQGRINTKNRSGKSIEERDEGINKREEYGHWEGDCIKGPQGQGTVGLYTLTERKTREQVILKIKTASQEEIKRSMDKLERRYGNEFRGKIKSITYDNGSEFLDWKGIETSVVKVAKKRTEVYFAHPYSSWERGSNENQNRMIRRFIPKGTDIGKVSEARIAEIENWMNNYPRKILGYRSANEMVLQLTQKSHLS
jgi:IS30 family transposase